jgi:hypothetical protein
MNTEQQAAQLELAAQILRTGHPWEFHDVLRPVHKQWRKEYNPSFDIIRRVSLGFEIRPILATPPDGRKLHNPDGLTAEQVGIGYRLTLEGEMDGKQHLQGELWKDGAWQKPFGIHHDGWFWVKADMIRLPLSTPWPEAKPVDSYAELKKAHAAGKVIQVYGDYGWDDTDGFLHWNLPVNQYRIKPWTMPEPPEGKQWHREDGWTENMLLNGYRPLLDDEVYENGDEGSCNNKAPIRFAKITLCIGEFPNVGWARTKRPLPKEEEYVPLEQSDIPAGARLIAPNSKNRFSIEIDNEDGVLVNGTFYSYQELMDKDVQILYPDSSEPQPCRKKQK